MFCFLLSSFSLSLTEPGRLYRATNEDFTKTFQQLVDHQSTATFSQRYQVNFTHATDNQTVFLYVGGESDTFSKRGVTDQMANYLKEFGAAFFQLEHRYYGESFPTDTMDTDNLKKYLTVDLALQDLQYFKQQMTTLYNLPSTAKWVVVGGSYPGLLSAYARAKYPDDFAAAISSSGVVYATNNYAEFDEQIAITHGEQCASVAREIRRRVDELLVSNPDWLLAQFNMTGLETENFYFVLGELFSLGPQYGKRDQLCGPLEDTITTGRDPVMALAKYAREVFIKNYADGDAVKTYSNAALKNTAAPNGPRSWLWQTCSELAYWQVNSGRLTLRSKHVDQDYFLKQCQDVFGETMTIPNTTKWNEDHIPLLKDASKIYYTTGSQDPWTPTCITADDADVISSDSVAHTIVGPEVGHCSDLKAPTSSDPEDLIRTRADIIARLKLWLADSTSNEL